MGLDGFELLHHSLYCSTVQYLFGHSLGLGHVHFAQDALWTLLFGNLAQHDPKQAHSRRLVLCRLLSAQDSNGYRVVKAMPTFAHNFCVLCVMCDKSTSDQRQGTLAASSYMK